MPAELILLAACGCFASRSPLITQAVTLP